MEDTENTYGFTQAEWNALKQLEWALTGSGASIEDVANLLHLNIRPQLFLVDPHWLADIINPEDQSDDHQRAHARSKRDRRRKSRGGRYTWGGQDDE